MHVQLMPQGRKWYMPTLNVRTYQDKVLLCELLHLFLLRSQGDVKVIDPLRQFNIVLL